MGSAVFKTNSAVWFGKELSPADSQPGAASRQPGGGVAGFGPSSPSAVGATTGDFAVADPRELAEWLRRSGGLAWAADERELDVAVECGHRWTLWAPGGQTVAFCKVGGGRVFIVDFDRALDLPGRIAYLSDLYVTPQMRRKGIGTALLVETLQFLRNESSAGVVCHIPRSNTASAGLFGSLGFVPLGQVRFTRILGIQLFSTRPERLLERMSSTCGSPGSEPGGRPRTGPRGGGPA